MGLYDDLDVSVAFAGPRLIEANKVPDSSSLEVDVVRFLCWNVHTTVPNAGTVLLVLIR